MSAEDFLFIVNNAIFLENFMKHFRSLAMLMLTITLTSTVCFYDEDRNKGGGCGWGLPDLTVVTISDSVISGVTPPAYGETPVTKITATKQFTGTVSWSPEVNVTFAGGTIYTATITLTARPGYTLEGVPDNFFTVAGATPVSNSADSGVVTAAFPETGVAPPTVVNISNIPGVAVPLHGGIPVTAITETSQFTGTVSWIPSHATFAGGTVYTATITLTAKPGYTLNGVAANFFTVAGATATNAANSGVVTAGFPATATVVNISNISGVPVPVYGDIPVTAITPTAQFTGTVSWIPLHATFVAETGYTATITLTAKPGYTLEGVNANFFTVAGATSVSNSANSGVVTAVFPVTVSPTFYSANTPGDIVSVTAGTVGFDMIYSNHTGTITFPVGATDDDYSVSMEKFFMSKTEVTWELWEEVYDWAVDSDRGSDVYTFQNSGRKGSAYGGTGMTEQHPVTMISWRDAIIWCNALSEMTGAPAFVYTANGEHGTTQYAPLRSSANGAYSGYNVEDVLQSVSETHTREGYRLPTIYEWEYTARYRGRDATNTVANYANPYFTKGNSASGAITYHNDTTLVGSDFAGRLANDAVAVCRYYWDGYDWVDSGTILSTAEVMSREANTLGLYDMSGNVMEWCFNSSGSYRILMGGSWNTYSIPLQVSYLNSNSPSITSENIGFRFARTKSY